MDGMRNRIKSLDEDSRRSAIFGFALGLDSLGGRMRLRDTIGRRRLLTGGGAINRFRRDAQSQTAPFRPRSLQVRPPQSLFVCFNHHRQVAAAPSDEPRVVRAGSLDYGSTDKLVLCASLLNVARFKKAEIAIILDE
jgi:hypothetical protein